MKYVLRLGLICMVMVCSIQVTAQDEIKKAAKKVEKNIVTDDTTHGWKFNGYMGFNFSQTSLNNWAAGGESSISTLSTVNVNANYKKNRFKWDNTLNINYGFIKQGGEPIQKNDDRIEVISQAGYRAKDSSNLFYTGFATFRTQFHATFNEDGFMISNFMSPAWLQAAIGMSYSKKNFSIIVAPIAGKFTIVNDQQMADSGDYGVEAAVIDPLTFQVLTPGSNIRTEIGAYLYVTYKVDVMKNITYSTRFDLFNNYSDPNVDNRKNFDVNWENMLTLKVNEYISTSFFTHLIYDQDIPIELTEADGTTYSGPRTQFKSVLGVGMSYKF